MRGMCHENEMHGDLCLRVYNQQPKLWSQVIDPRQTLFQLFLAPKKLKLFNRVLISMMLEG